MHDFNSIHRHLHLQSSVYLKACKLITSRLLPTVHHQLSNATATVMTVLHWSNDAASSIHTMYSDIVYDVVEKKTSTRRRSRISRVVVEKKITTR